MMKRMKALRMLRNKVVLITGGSSGIGKELALEAARRGAIVVVCARDLEKLNQVAQQCLILSGRPSFAYQLDVTDPDRVDEVLNTIRHEVGEIDVLVNAAGLGDFTAVKSKSRTIMKRMVDVNLLALMYLSRCVAKQMMDSSLWRHYQSRLFGWQDSDPECGCLFSNQGWRDPVRQYSAHGSSRLWRPGVDGQSRPGCYVVF